MALNHLHLHVSDVATARAFYETFFGFREDVWHRGTEDVRALRARLADPGVPLGEGGDDPDFVWFRTRDPDGYQIEVYWE